MGVKHMPTSDKGYKFILLIIDEISNFVVATPMKSVTSPEVCKILFDHFIAYFGNPVKIISDQDPTFTSYFTQLMFQKYNIKHLTVGMSNHKSLNAEHGIKSLSNIIMPIIS